jgi:hypothetical protein
METATAFLAKVSSVESSEIDDPTFVGAGAQGINRQSQCCGPPLNFGVGVNRKGRHK